MSSSWFLGCHWHNCTHYRCFLLTTQLKRKAEREKLFALPAIFFPSTCFLQSTIKGSKTILKFPWNVCLKLKQKSTKTWKMEFIKIAKY